jgi:hypothetical protein
MGLKSIIIIFSTIFRNRVLGIISIRIIHRRQSEYKGWKNNMLHAYLGIILLAILLIGTCDGNGWYMSYLKMHPLVGS